MSDGMPDVPLRLAGASNPEIRYACGHNNYGTREHEVLRMICTPDGTPEETRVVLRGLSRAKTEAIVMILNAPEV